MIVVQLAVDLSWTCCATSCPTCCKTCCLFYNLLWTSVVDLLLAFDLLWICCTTSCSTNPQHFEANGVRHLFSRQQLSETRRDPTSKSFSSGLVVFQYSRYRLDDVRQDRDGDEEAGDVVEHERRDVGVRVLERLPHSFTDGRTGN